MFHKFSTYSALVLALSHSASAEDFLLGSGSARSAATGGVYDSRWRSASDAMAANPAGLASIGVRRLDLNAAAMFARGEFQNAANTDGRLRSNGVLPFGAFATPVKSSRWTVGVAALPQLMSAARWSYTDAPGGAGNVSYPDTRHNSEILATRFAAGVGYALNKHVQIGATVGAVYNANTLETAYVFQEHPALAGLKTQLALTTTGVGWNGTVGVIVKPTSRLEFGAAYKTSTNIVSRGSANGNIGVQLATIGLGGARPDFRYDARVDNVLPQSFLAHAAFSIRPTLRLSGQTEWVNWARAFRSLPVTLTNGNNADINGVLGSDGIRDAVPLLWSNQMVARAGIEKQWRERTTFRAGYAYANNPVPSSTLSPLTAAITRNTITAGAGYTFENSRLDVAYGIDPMSRASSGESILKSGEYSNSRVGVRVQSVLLSWSVVLP